MKYCCFFVFETVYVVEISYFQVDVLVASAGGVEEDFIKCLAPTYLGDFKLKGLK